MISLKAIQTSFTPTKDALFHIRKLSKKKNSILSLCKSNDAGSDASPPEEGNTRQQELLARIAMLQAQKVRLTDYLDERSAYLTQFAEEANAEFDEIGENALKELDDAGARIMENIESQMQAFEESAELALIGLLVIGISDALISSSSDWQKVAVLGVISMALLSQFIYEQGMSSETERTEKEKTEEEKK